MDSIPQLKLNIETCVLVAIWQQPFIFQGFYRICELNSAKKEIILFFRYESYHKQQIDILDDAFSPYDYSLTHLYNESGILVLKNEEQKWEHPQYLLKYALHTTLKELIKSQKHLFTVIDDIAMHSMIERVRPILKMEMALTAEDSIGFAVAMDFIPQEEIGLSAAITLLNQGDLPYVNWGQAH